MINKLKGFPLSLEQKEELVNMMKEIAGSANGGGGVLEGNLIYSGYKLYLEINGTKYHVDESISIWNIRDTNLLNYCFNNNITKMIIKFTIDGEYGKETLIAKSINYQDRENSYVGFINIDLSDIGFDNLNVWIRTSDA